VLAAVPAAPARSRSGQRNGRRWELSGGLGSRLGGCPATVLALCGDQRDLDKGDGAEQLGAAEEWPALGGGRPHPYVGVARQTGIGRTGGRTRAADHGTWRDNFDAPRCGCGLGRRGASGRRGLRMARPREAARGLGHRGLARRKARGRRRGARARIPTSINSGYPCLTEFISKFLN
jgi:hypothetical protein